jgi:hypothetical protein
MTGARLISSDRFLLSLATHRKCGHYPLLTPVMVLSGGAQIDKREVLLHSPANDEAYRIFAILSKAR